MLTINKYLPKPTNQDEDVQQKINYMYSILLLGMGVNLFMVFVSPVLYLFSSSTTLLNPLLIFGISGAMLLCCYFSYRLLLAGYVDSAVLGIVPFLGVGLGINIFISPKGMYDPVVLAALMIMIIISYFASGLALTIFTYTTAVILIIEYTLEVSGIKATTHPEPPFFHLILYLIIIFCSQWVLKTSLQNLENRTNLLRQSRDELKKYQVELERKVDERTAQLEMKKLRAEDASSAKSLFLANMSHELRTPLNAIIGYSELIEEDLEMGTSTDLIADDIGKVRDAAKNLLGLINNILDLSKVEAKQIDLHIEAIPVKEIVQQLDGLLMPIFQINNNLFVIEPFNPDWIVLCDEQKVQQVFINLISNANKFTQNGVISLSIEEDDGMLCFAVKDTGIGIERKFINEIFKPFTQQDSRLSKEYEGTGLGLAITKKLVEMMRGQILVESEIGVGSTFKVMLPLVQQKGQRFTAERMTPWTTLH